MVDEMGLQNLYCRAGWQGGPYRFRSTGSLRAVSFFEVELNLVSARVFPNPVLVAGEKAVRERYFP